MISLKDGENSFNIVKVGMHSYFPNVDLNLWLNFNFAKLVKRETSLCGFAKVGLKGGETPSFDFTKVSLKGGENGSAKLETNATF